MEITWTDEEIKEFDMLVDMASSPSQLERIEARLSMPKFIEKHGKEKCDAMFSFLESQP
jgi:hypothetical protein